MRTRALLFSARAVPRASSPLARGTRALALALTLTLAACGRKAPEDAKPAEGMVIYRDTKGLFSCQIPKDWRVAQEDEGEQRVIFLGPPTGPKPFSTSISISFIPRAGGSRSSPRSYAEAHLSNAGPATPIREFPSKEGPVLEYSLTRKVFRRHAATTEQTVHEDVSLIPLKEGFFAVEHTTPDGLQDLTAPVFRSLLKSLEF